ncbi:MAG: hypothetical protein Q8K86_08885 [Candidatus Nanopelagicaceae bacterium]|nr:hypothetical protein [Candidatus Nanopelagicaceae bacterium]
MIDWVLTSERVGTVPTLSGYRPKVVCRCDGCDTERVITVRKKSVVVDGQMTWFCSKCVGKREDVRAKLSATTKRKWSDKKYVTERRECSKRLWQDEKFAERVAAGDLRHYYGDSTDVAQERDKRRKKSAHNWRMSAKPWANMTPERQERQRLCSVRWWNKNREMLLEKQRAYRERHRLPIYGTTIQKCRQAKFFNIHHTHRSRYVIAGTPEPWPTTQQLEEILNRYIVGDKVQCHHCKKHVDMFHFDHLDGIRVEKVDPSRIVISCPYCNISRANKGVVNRTKIGDIYVVQQISVEEANAILVGHFLGRTNKATTSFGLYKEARLIGACCFAVPPHPGAGTSLGINDHELMDLDRLFVVPAERVSNLMSFFIRRSIKYLHKLKPGLKAVISYCEHQFEGGSHIAAGMIPLEGTRRDKVYLDGNGQMIRRTAVYRAARKEGMLEAQYAKFKGLIGVMTPPKTKFLVPLEK